ncbi:IS481 family transposase [Pseudomonas helleri]|uniref:IS481 family transposase n=1 Tax=Pseudomonas helleri TaxID=1608996 RepID=UPI00381A2C0E
MSWKEVSAVDLRLEFVALALAEGANITALCEQFNIGRTTAYKWLKRFQCEGKDGLRDRSRRPHISPNRTAHEPEKQILALNIEHTGWGARKIKGCLERRGSNMPAASTVHAILKRNERIDPHAGLVKPFTRFEHEQPNDLWQMDFKGHVPMRTGRCHPLTLLDDHSRFFLTIAACGNEQRNTVQAHLINAFRHYGLPERMTMDNGAPWGDEPDAYTGLEIWIMRQGVRVSHSRPYHPQTQGKLERQHRSMIREVFKGLCLIDLPSAQFTLDEWRKIYNFERPHGGIGMQVPASRYTPSAREYQEVLPAIEYGAELHVRKVQDKGEIYWQGQPWRLGKGFKGERVGVREGVEYGQYDVFWGSHRIAQIDRVTGVVISGKKLR